MAILTERNARLASVVLCGLLFVLGLVIIIPMTLLSSSVDGKCLLYAATNSYGPDSACTFPIVAAVIFHIIVCLPRAVLVVVVFVGVVSFIGKDLLEHTVFLIGCAVADVIACLLTLISGGLISRGFSIMCSDIFGRHSDMCGDIQIYNSDTNKFLTDYYRHLNIAEVGVWLSWMLWICMILLDMFLLWKAELLAVSKLPFSLPCHSSGSGSAPANRSDAANRKYKDVPVSDPDNVRRPNIIVKRSTEDTPGGSRTPPPKRPVPPRPENADARY